VDAVDVVVVAALEAVTLLPLLHLLLRNRLVRRGILNLSKLARHIMVDTMDITTTTLTLLHQLLKHLLVRSAI
jgi:hypothetical protein